MTDVVKQQSRLKDLIAKGKEQGKCDLHGKFSTFGQVWYNLLIPGVVAWLGHGVAEMMMR